MAHWIRSIILVLVLLNVVSFGVDANAQTPDWMKEMRDNVELRAQGSFVGWPKAKRHYQHEYRAGVDGTVHWRFLEAVGYFDGIFYQSDDSQIPSSPVNVENNMADVVKYGGTLRIKKDNVFVGPTVHRTMLTVVARRRNEFGYLDGWGGPAETWRGEEGACRAKNKKALNKRLRVGVGCPSIAYQDGAGVAVGYDGSTVFLSGRWIFYRWKTLTLAPRPIRLKAVVKRPQGFWFEVQAWRDLAHRWRGDTEIRYKVIDRLWATIRVGYLQPDHKLPFFRYGVGITIR